LSSTTEHVSGLFLGIFEGHFDPAVAIVRDGRVLAYAEEERFRRYKHAPRLYPDYALRWCLETAGCSIEDIAGVGINWNAPAFADGRMAAFFDSMARAWPLDAGTVAWQRGLLSRFTPQALTTHHERQWRRLFGERRFPPLMYFPHHEVHAFQSFRQSGFAEALVLTIDGSGDDACTVLWRGDTHGLTELRRIQMPHSLGWVYAAITEYLGFEAYDGEYKVMGLAAYGSPNQDLAERLRRVVYVADDGIEYRVAPEFIHYGPHSTSDRYTDHLPTLLGRPPFTKGDTHEAWHRDLAYETQALLEAHVERLVLWGVRETGLRHLCIGGGVGLNVKLNSRLFRHVELQDVFAHPLCSDGGAAHGVALMACAHAEGTAPERLDTVALGPAFAHADIVRALEIAKVPYTVPERLADTVAAELAAGRIVGWVDGRMEAGPRALGHRSILADPRHVDARDRVNAVIKYREMWRPFCPSMPAERASDYLVRHTRAPFMIIAFEANERMAREAPAVVHVDGTARVQLVDATLEPRYHALLTAFGARTGTPILLNTSFNVKGEPIVCTPFDALRTFWSTGLDLLVLGDCLIRKPGVQPL
jgi:carbamoyltransferase